MSDLPIEFLSDTSSELQTEIQSFVDRYHSLEQGLSAPAPVLMMVNQDEYSIDLVVQYREGLCLVYDFNCVGMVAGVTVWNHAPDAGEMLEARLKRGWKPRTSDLRDGAKIQGYASCLMHPE